MGRAARFVRLLALFVCGIAAFLVVGVASASAWEPISLAEEEKYAEVGIHIVRHSTSFQSGEALRWCSGTECHYEPEITLPAGEYDYVYTEGNVPIADNHECEITEEGRGKETCKGSPVVVPGFTFVSYKLHDSYELGSVIKREIGWAYRPFEGQEGRKTEQLGEENEGEPTRKGCLLGYPVNCATGNEVQTQTDLSVGGQGPRLQLTLTYNSLLAVKQATAGSFGFGWTGSYSAHLELKSEGREAIVHQDNGSTVTFTRSGEAWTAPSGLVEATLTNEGGGYVYTLPDQTALHFNSTGVLTSEVDRNGNTLTMSYESKGRLESIGDAAGRKLTLVYNSEGEVENAKDPMGHTVKYTYESGNLVSVTLPGKEKANWKYKYNSEHELTSETDGREHTVTTEYSGSHQVASQTDAMSRKRTWKYVTAEPGTETTITEPSGASTVERFNEQGSPTSVTHAAGTSVAATTTYEYNSADELMTVNDPNKHITKYSYDAQGNRTKMIDPDEHETKWEYNSTHDVISMTTPKGETTTIKRDGHGNAESVSRPAPKETVQATKYAYDSHGDVESMTNPLGRVWKYEYDTYGDRTAEIDPEGDKRTWAYNKDSQETSTVSPRGNVTGGEPSAYTTTIERDAQGRPVLVTEPERPGVSKPINTLSASISGVAREGIALSANVGMWQGAAPLAYSYQWERCNAAGESCSNISGTTSKTYSPTHSDVGSTLRVVVTATNSAGSASNTSAATVIVSAAVSFAFQFGSSGTGNGQFNHPYGVAIDGNGNLWVTDSSNNRIQKFSASGTFLGAYGSKGSAGGQFELPWAIAINDVSGNVYVGDYDNSRIEEFSSTGAFVRTFGFGVSNGKSEFQICTSSCGRGISGSGNGQIAAPTGITVDAQGNVWVANLVYNDVEEFSEQGEYLRRFGTKGSGNGQLLGPQGIAVSGETLYVADAGNSRVEEFSLLGEYVGQWGSNGTGSGQFIIERGITVDPVSGDLYVADQGNYRVEQFSPTGAFLAEFGSHGTGEGQDSGTANVAVTPGGEVYVTDEYNARIDTWELIPSAPVFVSSFGMYGSENGQFHFPSGTSFGGSGDQWVTDSNNNRIEKFSSSGSFLASYGSYGTKSDQFIDPTGISTNQSTGNVYIADQANNRIEELSAEGTFVAVFGFGVTDGKGEAEVCTSSCRAGTAGTGNGQFNGPAGLTVDPTGSLWVVDKANNRIEELSSSGSFLATYGSLGSGSGQFNSPAGVVYANANIYVTDSGNNRIEELSTGGSYLRQFGTGGTGNGQFKGPAGIAEGPSGVLYIADEENNRIQEFTPSGAYLTSFGAKGSGSGQFSGPYSVTFSSSGNVYVADQENNRIDQWRLAGAPSNTTLPGISGELALGQTLSASTGTWSATPAPTYNYQWDRCNNPGESCSPISGATGSTYVLGHSDIGHFLRVVVTATNTAGYAEGISATTEMLTRGRITEYAYDANGNLETQTEPNGNETRYTYNADNQPIKVTEPNGTVTETGYDGAGHVTSQTDGNKHETKYVRNILGEVTEVVDPLGRKTTMEHDSAGNLKALTDPAKRTIAYTYDPANRLTEISYSDGKTHAVKYEYDTDGYRTKMTDGTGTTTYTYDQLDRLTESKDGHGDTTGYEYDLANEQTKITYPNSKAVTRAYDKAGRLEKVTDWLEHTTTFAYDPDSHLTTITFPSGTSNVDKYAYNESGQLNEAKMTKGTEVLASLNYTGDNDGQVKKTVTKGLPGSETTEYAYDENYRLTKAGTIPYEYDLADSPTKAGSSTNTYDNADELKTGTGLTYTYDELGERTKITPTAGPATTYGYDEAGNLTNVERPKEGETAEIKDTYAYDGNRLRASQTISGTVSYLAWGYSSGALPVLLNDSTHSYIYGANNQPIEQINNTTGTVQYLHHDQAGSTRLITGSTGTIEGTYTYTPYGGVEGHTGTATTPLGYDAQYMNNDTGLIYLRARVYDPTTAQFLTVDPIYPATRALYNYANDNPINYMDRTGLCSIVPGSSENCFSEVPGAIGSVGESVARNPVAAGGIILGGVAVGTGAGAVAAAGAAGAESASALGAASAVSGFAGAGLDAVGCAGGSGIGCIGAGLGTIASGGAVAVGAGIVGGEAASGVTAIGLPSGFLGFLGDVAGALAPSSSSGAPSGFGPSSGFGSSSGFGASLGSGC